MTICFGKFDSKFSDLNGFVKPFKFVSWLFMEKIAELLSYFKKQFHEKLSKLKITYPRTLYFFVKQLKIIRKLSP